MTCFAVAFIKGHHNPIGSISLLDFPVEIVEPLTHDDALSGSEVPDHTVFAECVRMLLPDRVGLLSPRLQQ